MSRSHWSTIIAAQLMVVGIVTTTTQAADPNPASPEVARIDARYAADSVTETPDFRQDIVPLLGKLGCNGRACHGSFQGQGGLRLSLFGYDFKSDHEMLTQGEKPRVDTKSVAESLILQKPLQMIPHEGGTRITAGTWQHRVLTKWIEGGAKSVTAETPDFVRLDVTPEEIVATKRGETFTLKAVAVWSNGTKQDVTPLCRFQTNNDQVATVDQAGIVTSAGPGDTHVIAFYDNGVVPVPVIQPVSDKTGDKYPAVATPTKIDELVVQKLRKLGMVRSEICTDAEFLRRASLDITGTLPTAAEVEAFLVESASESTASKRARKIDDLLERPAYAAWWATKFADWTGNNVTKLNNNKSGIDAGTRSAEWYEWLRTRVEKNVAYDELAEGIILAVSRQEGENFNQYCERMSAYHHKDPHGSYAEQPSMTYYWSRREFQKPEERALGFAYTFLGLRIQCAQCHKHPFDQWTKDDFDRFTGFFSRLRYGTIPGTKDDENAMLEKAGIDYKNLKGNDLGRAIRDHLAKNEVMPFDELFVPAANRKPAAPAKDKNGKPVKRPQVVAGRTAKILGGEEIKIEDMADPREALMDWLRDEHNPYFAKAIVNRIWSGYFNAGIVEPADDLSLANPPSNEPLLDYLTAEFRAHGYDMKWLHRTIANSLTYQLSWHANETNQYDERNFARAVPRRLPAEVAYDSVQLATMSDSEAAKWHESVKGRAIANAGMAGRGNKAREDYALTIFGKSSRESNCECDRSMEASLLQTVYLRNDDDVLAMIGGKGRWVEQIQKQLEAASGQVKSDASAPPKTAENTDTRQSRKAARADLEQLKRKLENATRKNRTDVVAVLEKQIAAREKQLADESKEPEQAKSASAPPDLMPIIRQAYLRTLGRYPTDTESNRALKNYTETADVGTGTKDLLWALVNTKEFVINH